MIAYYNVPMPTPSQLCLAALFAFAIVGCEDPEKEKAKAAELQRKTDEQIAKIQGEAAEKVTAAEKKMAELQGQLAEAGAQVKAEADEEVAKAKGEADKLASEASSALRKARAAYKEEEQHALADVTKQIDDVRAKAKSAEPKVKTDADKALKDIATKKDAVKKDIDAFDTTSLEALKSAKAKTDQAIAQLKQAIRAAQAKLK